MAWRCVAEGRELEDVRKDRKTVKYIEKYGFSEEAVYFDGKYLPVSLIRSLKVKPSVYYPNHSCGKGLPVFKIGLDYGGEKLAVLMMEKGRNVDKAVSMICEAVPAVIVDIDTATGEKLCRNTSFE